MPEFEIRVWGNKDLTKKEPKNDRLYTKGEKTPW